MRLVLRLIVPIAAILAATASAARADTIVYNINDIFAGCSCPSNVTATFTDVSGGVELTLDATTLPGGWVVGWYFNVTDVDPTALTISNTGGVSTATVSQGTDQYKADGDGYFDLLFSFTGSQLAAGSTSTWLITLTDLTVDNFIDISVDGPQNKTGFYAAAKLQGPTGSSAWAADSDGPDIDIVDDSVPEPATLLLTGAGLAVAGLRRRFKAS